MLLPLLVALGIAGAGVAATPSPALTRRASVNATVVIEGVITSGSSRLVIDALTAMATSKEPVVTVIINTPGGSIGAGKRIIAAMDQLRSQGAIVQCFVPGIAMSMGARILLHCTDRYGSDSAHYLWHEGRYMGMGIWTADLMLRAAVELAHENRLALDELLEFLPVPKELIVKSVAEERVWSTRELEVATQGAMFIKTTEFDEALLAVYKDPKTVRLTAGGLGL